MASVVGGWCLLIVVFAVASTLTLSVRQRDREMALLKSVGATPGQVGRMIVGRGAVVALVASALAIPPALVAGRLLLDLLERHRPGRAGVAYRFGPVALGIGFWVTVLGAVIAALVTRAGVTPDAGARRAGRRVPAGWAATRVVVALLLLAGGLNLRRADRRADRGKGIDAMQTAGQASIWASVGLGAARRRCWCAA